MPWQPTLLEDSLDPWLALEPDAARRRAVIDFLIRLCDAGGSVPDAPAVPNTRLPAFAGLVPDQGVVIVWVVAETYEQLAIRYLYDLRRGLLFGG